MEIRDFPEAVFAGYLAAFLDGEGCIEIGKPVGLRIRLANTFKAALDGIHQRLGYGRVHETARGNKPNHYLPLYFYEVSNAPDVEKFLLVVRPYVTIKRVKTERALVVISGIKERIEALDARNRAILARLALGHVQKEVARDFGISQGLVSRIKSGHTWHHEVERFNARRSNMRKGGFRTVEQSFRIHGPPPSGFVGRSKPKR